MSKINHYLEENKINNNLTIRETEDQIRVVFICIQYNGI